MKRQKDMTLKDELPKFVDAQYTTGEQWRNNSRKNEAMELKQKQCPVVRVTGDESKVQSVKNSIAWKPGNIRAMSGCKLEVVKQEMARVNINILGIGKLKWTGMGKFNSDDHYIYCCGQEPSEGSGPHS